MTDADTERLTTLSKKVTELLAQYKEAIELDEIFEISKGIWTQVKEVQKQIKDIQDKY